MIINWCIPDVPQTLRLKMNKEKRFLDEILLERKKRMSSKNQGSDNFSFYETLEKNPHNNDKEMIEMQPVIVIPNPTSEDEFEEIVLESPKPSTSTQNTSVANIQDIVYKNTEGVFPEDIRMSIKECNVSDLTATMHELSDLVEELNNK